MQECRKEEERVPSDPASPVGLRRAGELGRVWRSERLMGAHAKTRRRKGRERGLCGDDGGWGGLVVGVLLAGTGEVPVFPVGRAGGVDALGFLGFEEEPEGEEDH
jgi:hypothetical protein